MDKLQELMRLCYNAGAEDVDGFDNWWMEYGQDRYRDFLQLEADPEMIDVLKGLLRTLNTVIETANEIQGVDFIAGDLMKWGAQAKDLIGKLDTE